MFPWFIQTMASLTPYGIQYSALYIKCEAPGMKNQSATVSRMLTKFRSHRHNCKDQQPVSTTPTTPAIIANTHNTGTTQTCFIRDSLQSCWSSHEREGGRESGKQFHHLLHSIERMARSMQTQSHDKITTWTRRKHHHRKRKEAKKEGIENRIVNDRQTFFV